ncbi:MAG: hypothetical protein AAFV95_06595 [Bacteroidota bacterium]
MKRIKLQLGPSSSDLFVCLYILATLFGRVYIEPQLAGNYLISIAIGAFSLLFLWALVKSKFISPSWFGLLGDGPIPE